MVENRYGQTIGAPVDGWTPRRMPSRAPIEGRFCRVASLEACHADDLFAAYAAANDGRDWTYLPVERFADSATYRTFVAAQAESADPLHHVIIDKAGGRPAGTAALMRIDPANGVIELGHIAFSPFLQRKAAGTEALFLLMCRVFDELGYRRLEWKCDSFNAPSRRAAMRYGFLYEGLFRRSHVTKGRNRDTAWYAIIDQDWPALRTAFEAWLSVDNFAADGTQKRSLSSFRD